MTYSDLFRTAAAAALSLAMAAVPAVAKNGNAKVKVAKPTSAGPKAKAPKAQTTKAAKAQAPKSAKAQAPKATGAATTKSSTRSASTTNGSSTRTNRSGDGTPATSLLDFAAPSQPLSKAQEKLLTNPNLAEKMRLRLGSDPMVAASGFKNFGQFVAAVNASNNQGIDFNLLKGLMVNRGMSLGQAKKQAKAIEARRANFPIAPADDEINPLRPTTTAQPVDPSTTRGSTTTQPVKPGTTRRSTTTKPAGPTTTRPSTATTPVDPTTTRPVTSTTTRKARGKS